MGSSDVHATETVCEAARGRKQKVLVEKCCLESNADKVMGLLFP